MLKNLFHYSNQTCIKLVPILFFQIIDPSINNVMENAMESSIHDVSKNPTQIQTRNDTETFTDLNTTGKSPINFLK